MKRGALLVVHIPGLEDSRRTSSISALVTLRWSKILMDGLRFFFDTENLPTGSDELT